MIATASNYDLISREHACELNILGNGFFIVRDVARGQFLATQSGHFKLDAEGYLVTESGHRAQGFIGSNLHETGDLQIHAGNLPAACEADTGVLYYAVDETGRITVHLTDCSSFVGGQILLQNFEDPRALISEGRQLYSNLNDAGPLAIPAQPGSQGLGLIQTGALEFPDPFASGWTI